MLQILKLGNFFLFVSLDFHQEKWIYVHKGSTKEVSIHLLIKFIKGYA